MDAISFVLGIRSAQLRSTQLKDLIYRAGKAGQHRDEAGPESEAEEEEQTIKEKAQSASVTAVYKDKQGEEYKFQRT